MTLRFASLALLLVAAPAAAKADVRPSDYRPGVTVEYLYKQQIDAVYFTIWYGRLEKTDGAWRDVYFETGDKFVNKGLISFNCIRPKADIGLILYSTGTYGDVADRRLVVVPYADRKAWADGGYEPLAGETPPFDVFRAALARFCQ